MHPTFDVCHDNPTFRRYPASVVIGAESRAAMDDLLKSPQVARVVADQRTVLTAVHASTVERSMPAIRMVAR